MTAVDPEAPHPVWNARIGATEIRCLGRGPRIEPTELPALLGEPALTVAWLRQAHSDRAVRAAPGACGEGDALISDRPDLALCVVTADCVPVVVGRENELAVIHAGWRGIVVGIIPRTLEAMAGAPEWAWIGPAIGPCCYEVGEDVAADVGRAAGSSSVVLRGRAKPHVDLPGAAEAQLRATGVETIHAVRECTRCSQRLWSHRGDGSGAGRNLTFAWLTAGEPLG